MDKMESERAEKLSEKQPSKLCHNESKNGGKTENINKRKQVTNLFFFTNIRVTFQTIGGTIIKITNYFSERRR
ncbi:MAG: hypothetical protein ACLRX7_00215 [Acutalibacteraceae bacterium]